MDRDRENQKGKKLSVAFTDEERFRLLVNAVTDYAIYMLDASGISRAGTPVPSASRATPPLK